MLEMSLVHALAATRDLARRHDGEVWRRLEARTSGLLARTHAADPDQDTGTAPRLEREGLATEHHDAVMAALLAVGEAPDDQRAAAALERLDALDGGEGRDDGPQPPESDPALVDEGW